MHVVMAVVSFRLFSIQTMKFLALGGYYVLEGANQQGMKDASGKGRTRQERANCLLTFPQPSRTVRPRKRGCKIQVQAGIDAMFTRHSRRSRGVFRKDHSADRGHCSALNALESSVRCVKVQAPIVGVDDET